jgi:hypothetical protein
LAATLSTLINIILLAATMASQQRMNIFTLLLAICFLKSDAFAPNLQRNVETRLYGNKVNTKKTTERAFNERNFESMMGNDWREFRAKLVAQEKAAASLRESTAYYHGSKLMAKHGRIGDLFAGSINIFDDRICGVLDCNDPFVSKDELPIIMQRAVSIDKHRWAHPIPRPEQGSILISNERFHQTVVLVISHCDKNGSSGVVINRYVKTIQINLYYYFYYARTYNYSCIFRHDLDRWIKNHIS